MQVSQGAVYLYTNPNMSCKFIPEHMEATSVEKWNLAKWPRLLVTNGDWVTTSDLVIT